MGPRSNNLDSFCWFNCKCYVVSCLRALVEYCRALVQCSLLSGHSSLTVKVYSFMCKSRYLNCKVNSVTL